MKLSDFDYTLPANKIAKVPAVPRDSSKLLILDKNTGKISDDHFYNLDKYLKKGDVLVRNNTKVIPARIFGKKDTSGKVEILLIKKLSQTDKTETWECLTKPNLKNNQQIFFNQKLSATCTSTSKKSYTKILEFNQMGPKFIETLEEIGITPLPPYIADETQDSDDIRKKYQTIYAKYDGSSAAPTAGLHFTKELEKKLIDKGIYIVEVTLHVGLGTFLPVKTDDILDHHMHSEWFEISKQSAQAIEKAKNNGQRIIAVGTTSSRVLESATRVIENNFCQSFGELSDKKCNVKKVELKEQSGDTEIFMYPGYQFNCVDGLITNFHLPKSTLLMLVSALVCKPNTAQNFSNFLQSTIGKAYLHAIENEYRFYSFGDGMLII